MKRLTLERSGPLATLWLDRPDKRNALDGALMKDLGEVLDEIGDDASIRAVLLRGRGPVFSSGIDHSLLTDVASGTDLGDLIDGDLQLVLARTYAGNIEIGELPNYVYMGPANFVSVKTCKSTNELKHQRHH